MDDFVEERAAAVANMKELYLAALARRQARRDVRACLPELAKLGGKRIESVSVTTDGSMFQLRFTDGSCFLVEPGEQFFQGTHYETSVSVMDFLLAAGAFPGKEPLPPLEGDPKFAEFNRELRSRFLALWTKAGGGEYDKAEWKAFRSMLGNLGMQT